MPERLEHPPHSRGDPSATIVVGHDDIPIPEPDGAHPRRERSGGGQRMTARGTESRQIAQVVVDVEMDGAREVAGLVRTAPSAPLTERPAAVDDAEPGLAGANATDEAPGGDQR
jgi:hypothetical protein